MNMSLMLRGHPDWHGAAEVLIEGCAHLPTEEARVRWMERLCLTLGDALYPAFLKVLCHVGEHADPGAQQAVAETLVSAMTSGRLHAAEPRAPLAKRCIAEAALPAELLDRHA